MKQRSKIIVVVGPTASGKSSLAVEIAKQFGGEVISADSRQVYRSLDIGTAKITKEEMRGVPHHLLDIADPTEIYTAADFVRDGRTAIADVATRSQLPVIAGGTLFYIDSLLGRISYPEVPPNDALRAELEELPTATLVERLEAADPARAKTIDTHNRRRLIRALEIVAALGSVPPPRETAPLYDTLTIGITTDPESLRARFRERGTTWLQGSFRAEVEELLQSGVSRERLHEIGFEYQLMLEYIDGTLDESAFVQRFVEKNWQYAKRQYTWLKRNQSIHWFTKDDPQIFEAVKQFLGT
jgi:tRNA dimethylallyltransferase